MNPEYRPIEGPFTLEAKHPIYVLYDKNGSVVVQVVMDDVIEALRCIVQTADLCRQAQQMDYSDLSRYDLVDGEWVRKS